MNETLNIINDMLKNPLLQSGGLISLVGSLIVWQIKKRAKAKEEVDSFINHYFVVFHKILVQNLKGSDLVIQITGQVETEKRYNTMLASIELHELRKDMDEEKSTNIRNSKAYKELDKLLSDSCIGEIRMILGVDRNNSTTRTGQKRTLSISEPDYYADARDEISMGGTENNALEEYQNLAIEVFKILIEYSRIKDKKHIIKEVSRWGENAPVGASFPTIL